LSGVENIRTEGGIVTDCLAITSYEFKEGAEAFKKAGVTLHTLTTFSAILDEALTQKTFTQDDKHIVEAWLKDPMNWGK